MYCSRICQCFPATPIVGMLNKPKIEEKIIVGCEVKTFQYSVVNHGSNEFIAPKSGYYLAIAVATGGNVNTVFNHGYGTEHRLVYLNQSDRITYSLGSNTQIKLPTGEVFEAEKVNGSNKEPLAVFQWLGGISIPALMVGAVGSYQNPRELNSYAGYELGAVVPLTSDIQYNNTGSNAFMFWAKTRVNFPTTGEYTFGSLGDDYVSVYLDGKPIILYSNIRERDIRQTKIQSTGGLVKLQVTAGEHDIHIWNLSDRPSEIQSAMFVNDSSGRKIAATTPDTEWTYVRSFTDCFTGITPTELSVIPNVPFPLGRTTETTTDATINLGG